MTKFESIYEQFLDKISDYDLIKFDVELQENLMLSYLKNAIAEFIDTCKKDLSDINMEDLCFNIDLSQQEIRIISDWMVVCWLEQYKNSTDLLKQHLNTKDYSVYSEAHLLNAISDLFEKSRKHADSKMREYSLRNSDIERWKRR